MQKFWRLHPLRTTILLLLTALVVSQLGACSQPPAPLAEAPPWQPFSGNFSYNSQVTNLQQPVTIIYYELLWALNEFWYYPVSITLEPEESSGLAIPLQAVNHTLAAISTALDLPVVQALNLEVQQGVAHLDLPSAFFDGIATYMGYFPRRAIEALVLTVTEFADNQQVQLLREGRIQSFITLDMVPSDISRPLPRPLPNSEGSSTPASGRVTLYLLHEDRKVLVPICYHLPSGELTPLMVFELLLQPPEQRRNLAPSVSLSGWLASPLGAFGGAGEFRPSFNLQRGTLQVGLPRSLVATATSCEQLELVLTALTRSLLSLENIDRVQFLVADAVSTQMIGLFALGGSIERLPFINRR